MTTSDFIEATERIESCLCSIAGEDHVERRQIDVEQSGSDKESEKQTDSVPAAEEDSQDETDVPLLLEVTESSGPDYVVICIPRTRFFQIRSGYNLFGDLFKNISEKKAQEYFEEELDEDVGLEELRRRATEEVLNGTTKQDRRDIIYQLTEIFTDATVKYEVKQIEGGGICSFETMYKVFPYEDSFNISSLNDKIEQVRMPTQQGRIYLRYAFQLGVDFQEETAGDATDGYAPTQSDPVSVDNLGPN